VTTAAMLGTSTSEASYDAMFGANTTIYSLFSCHHKKIDF
jgi:hypothetical protein